MQEKYLETKNNDFSINDIDDIKNLIIHTIKMPQDERIFWENFNLLQLTLNEKQQLIDYANDLKIKDESPIVMGFVFSLVGCLYKEICKEHSVDLFEKAVMLDHHVAMFELKQMHSKGAEVKIEALEATSLFEVKNKANLLAFKEKMNEAKLFSLKFEPELITEKAQRIQRESVNKNCLKSAINGSLEESNSSLPFFKFAHFGPEVKLSDIHTISPFTFQFKSDHTGILLIITSEDTDKESLKISSDNKKALLACSELPQLIAILKTIPNGEYLAETIEPFVDSNTNTL